MHQAFAPQSGATACKRIGRVYTTEAHRAKFVVCKRSQRVYTTVARRAKVVKVCGLRREIKEVVSLDINNLKLIGVYNDPNRLEQ